MSPYISWSGSKSRSGSKARTVVLLYPPIYYLGCDARRFDSEIDTLWLDKINTRISRSVPNSTKLASGQKWINTIKNLATSPDYIAEGGARPGNIIRSWLDMSWYDEVRLFGSLRHVHVSLGTTWRNRDTVYESEGFYIQREKLMDSSSVIETLDQVEWNIKNFEYIVELIKNNELPLPEGASDWQDESGTTFGVANNSS